MLSSLRSGLAGSRRVGFRHVNSAAAAASQQTQQRAFSDSAELVLVEKHADKGVAVVTINRPKAVNALNDEIMTLLQSKLEEIDTDD